VDDIVRENGSELARLLQGREGWRLDVQDGVFFWCFGVAGAARLTVTPGVDGFLIHSAEGDEELFASGIGDVREWLDVHEAEHAGLTPLQEEFKRALEEKERGAPGD
jgi:hypothetical protein